MYHSEINNRPDEPMRFIQMWFLPREPGLTPAVEQKEVHQSERTDRLLPLVSNDDAGALRIASEAKVYSCFQQKGNALSHALQESSGGYLYVLEGGPISINDKPLHHLDAALLTRERDLFLKADGDAELLLVVVPVKT